MTLKLVTKWIKRKEIAKERMEICKACDHYDESRRSCKHCGCYLEYKTEWPWANCPLEKWNSYIEDTENGIHIS